MGIYIVDTSRASQDRSLSTNLLRATQSWVCGLAESVDDYVGMHTDHIGIYCVFTGIYRASARFREICVGLGCG